MVNLLDEYYESQDEPNKGCLLALRQIILEQDLNVSETRKYGMPCFTFHGKLLCFLWTDKKTKEPYILLVDGLKIDHPLLEQGSRAKMKILRVNPSKDLPIEAITQVSTMAIKLKLD